MLDSAGFPCACEILPGNVSECGTLADAIARLRQERGTEQPPPSVVMDAGIATEANLAWLREQGYDRICVNRRRQPPPPERAPDLDLITASRTTLQAQCLGSEDGERRLYLRSDAKKQKQDAILSAKRTRFEAELRSLHEGVTVPGHTKKYERVLERVGRLRERHARVSRQYDIHVERDPGQGKKRPGADATAVRYLSRPFLDEADAGAGAYLLHTSHLDWELQDIVEWYLRITEVEAVFRALKSELGLRPIRHQADNQIRAHLFIAVLACHAVHLIRTRLKMGGRDFCRASTRNRLRNWVRITTTIQEVGAGQITCRQDVLPSAEAAEIARRVGVKPGNYRRSNRRKADRIRCPVGPWAPLPQIMRPACNQLGRRKITEVPTWGEIFRDTAEREMSATQLRKVRELAEDFARVWDAPQTGSRDRKRLLGFLIEDAVLSSDGDTIQIGLRMRGGHVKHLQPVPVPVPHWKQEKTRSATIKALDALLDTLPERKDAEELNWQGHTNWLGEPMTLRRVRIIMSRNKLKTWTARQLENMRQEGFVTARKLANRFNVAPTTIRNWARTGTIESRPFPYARKITHVYRAASGCAPGRHSAQQERNICQSQNVREAE